VKWDGKYVAGISKVAAVFKRTSEVVEASRRRRSEHRQQVPGPHEVRSHHARGGVTHDPEFEKWAEKVWSVGGGLGGEVSAQDFRKDIIIEVYNEAGQVVLAYHVFRCWVSEYQRCPIDANANAVAIEHIKIEERRLETRSGGGRAAEPVLP